MKAKHKKKEGFYCTKCKKFHIFGVYAVAQMAMGNTLTHKCDCGTVHECSHFRCQTDKT